MYISQVSGERLQDHRSSGSTRLKKDCRNFNTLFTSHMEEYRGTAGCATKTPFMNLVCSLNVLISILLQIFKNTLNTDHARPRDLYFNPESYDCDKYFKTALIQRLMFFPQK